MKLFISMVAIFALAATVPGPVYASDVDAGKADFAKLCASCHGEKGMGDGPIAAGLPENMKPSNLQDGEFKVATDDDKMKQVIKEGGAKHGLNPLMAPQPTLTDVQLANLVAFVKSLKAES